MDICFLLLRIILIRDVRTPVSPYLYYLFCYVVHFVDILCTFVGLAHAPPTDHPFTTWSLIHALWEWEFSFFFGHLCCSASGYSSASLLFIWQEEAVASLCHSFFVMPDWAAHLSLIFSGAPMGGVLEVGPPFSAYIQLIYNEMDFSTVTFQLSVSDMSLIFPVI